jgi:hypothetical protein
METFLTPIVIIPLMIFLGFGGVIAPMLLPFFIKDEFKDQFESKLEVWQTPYLYQAKWFKPKGVMIQRVALMVWVPAIIYGIYFWLSGGLDGIQVTAP